MKFTKSLLKTSAAVALVASAQAAVAGGHGEITVVTFWNGQCHLNTPSKWAHTTKKWVSK